MIVNRQIQDACNIKNDNFNLIQFSIDFVVYKLIWRSIIPIEPILVCITLLTPELFPFGCFVVNIITYFLHSPVNVFFESRASISILFKS